LEAQNRKLKADLDMLHGRKGKDTISIKTMYESEINVSFCYISTKRFFSFPGGEKIN